MNDALTMLYNDTEGLASKSNAGNTTKEYTFIGDDPSTTPIVSIKNVEL